MELYHLLLVLPRSEYLRRYFGPLQLILWKQPGLIVVGSFLYFGLFLVFSVYWVVSLVHLLVILDFRQHTRGVALLLVRPALSLLGLLNHGLCLIFLQLYLACLTSLLLVY